MTRRVVRAVLVAASALVAVVLLSGAALADTGASLSSVKRGADGTVTGTLTVSAGTDTAVVDMSTLRLVVEGQEYKVDGSPGSTLARSTILLIDRSGSMRDSGMSTVRSSVAQFLSTAPKDVKVGVVSFGDQATQDLLPTSDRGAVQTAVNALKSGGDTALYDGVALAVKTLGDTGDRSIVLLSDGKDTTSTTSAQQAEQLLTSGNGVRTAVIAFRTSTTDNLALEYLARAGGGTVTPVDNAAAVGAAFTAVAKALDSQVSWSAKTPTSLSGTQPVTLHGSANTGTFSASSAVDFGPPPPVPTPSVTTPAPTPTPTTAPPAVAAPLPGRVGGSGSFFTSTLAGTPLAVVVSALAMFAALALVVLAMSPAFRSQRRERLASIDQYVTPSTRRSEPRTTTFRELTGHIVQLGDRAVEGRGSTSGTTLLLQRADLPWRAGEWAVLRVAAVVVGLVIGGVVLHDGWATLVGLAFGTVVGLLAPPAVLRFLASRRAKRFERQLPDVLNLIASSLSTGFSLPQALDAIARDVAQPASKEFARAMAETRIGADVEDALSRMADRMDSENMRWAGMAVEIQRRVGGNLAETLRVTAQTLRERESLFRQVRTLSAEGRLSGWILVALPVGMFFWMAYVNPEYISLLWKSAFGIAMVVIALVLMVIGVFWMRKVVEVEV
ncbi:MAG TPA: VWA domain-containing protein [Lapillicoccus sp.]|uniref:VWA domain-containing protein n=1 Tax=Lapillicoccus sp. TaxID=1909287 RepID=UPI002F94EFF6